MTSAFPSLPTCSALYRATCDLMADIHGLKKDEKNSHGGYNYVSVDSFKAMVRPLMAKHGLSLSMHETSFELVALPNSKGGETMNAKVTYAFQLRHVSGEVDGVENLTIVLPLTGAQTAGAARSYALKEYLKGRFFVATGDKDLIEGGADADAFKQQEYSSSGKSAYRARKDGTDKEFQRIRDGLHKIEAEGTMEDLVLYWKNSQPKLKEMPEGWLRELTEIKDELKAQFEKGEEVPLPGAPGHDPDTGEVVEPDMSGDR